MALKIFLSSLILSFITIVPLGVKWEIEKKVTVSSAFFIGILAGAVSFGIMMLWELKFYQILIIDFLLIIVIAISFLLWRFYRDPERFPPEYDNIVLSPADGEIIYVKKIERGEIPFSEKNGKRFFLDDLIQSSINLKGKYLIGIGMNFLDVHVNRAPVGGRAILLKHIKGLYISLKKKEAVLQNERVLTVIDNGQFKVGIVQIASRLVRKIVPYIKQGQEIQNGERMGIIRFGSQVDLILPDLPSLNITVKPGEKVKACISIIANFGPINI